MWGYIREHFVWGYTTWNILCVGTQFFPIIIRENSVWGYTVFPLNNKGEFVWGTSLLPLYEGCSSCVSDNPGTVFPLNMRNGLLNSVIFYQTVMTSIRVLKMLIFLVFKTFR